MTQGIIRSLSILLAIAFLAEPFAHGQSQLTGFSPAAVHVWELASQNVPDEANLLVITIARPGHRSVCRASLITRNELTYKGSFGKTHTYKPEEIAALILAGDDALKLRLVAGFNVAAGLAAWGTYVLAPICIPCAVATGVAALFFVGAAGAVLIGDDQPDRLIYLAPAERLHDSEGHAIRLRNLPSAA